MVEKGFANLHGNVWLFLAKMKCSAFFKPKPPDSALSVSLGGSACLHKPALLRCAHPFLFITQPFRTDTDKTRLPADQLFWLSHRQPPSPLARTYGWGLNRKRCTTASVLCALACAHAAPQTGRCVSPRSLPSVRR